MPIRQYQWQTGIRLVVHCGNNSFFSLFSSLNEKLVGLVFHYQGPETLQEVTLARLIRHGELVSSETKVNTILLTWQLLDYKKESIRVPGLSCMALSNATNHLRGTPLTPALGGTT